jgi:hypothetical protein
MPVGDRPVRCAAAGAPPRLPQPGWPLPLTDPTRSPVSTSADINAWTGILNEYQDAA